MIGVVTVTAAIWLATDGRDVLDAEGSLGAPLIDGSVVGDGAVSGSGAVDPSMVAEEISRPYPGIESTAEESQRLERVRVGIVAGDAAVLDDARHFAILGSLCAMYASMSKRASRDDDSYRFLRRFLAERCGGFDLTLKTSDDGAVFFGDPILRIDDFIGAMDPEYQSAQSLSSSDVSNLNARESEDRRNQLIEIIMKTNYIYTLDVALQSFAFDRENSVDGRMRLGYVENLPRMGHQFDFRSGRFLALVAIQVGCAASLVECGPNSLFAVQLCSGVGTCRNGVSVQDYLMDHYSSRDLLASRIAAQRIVEARALRARGALRANNP